MTWIVVLISIIALYWLVATFVLAGKDLTRFDSNIEDAADVIFSDHPDDFHLNKKALEELAEAHKQAAGIKSPLKALEAARFFADNLSCELVTDTQFKTANANGVDCEWAIAPNADPAKRVLFLHGGAFIFGSSKGHRKFTDQLSKVTGSVVLSVNYRMLPKYNRKAGITDAQQAYCWLIDNAPDGQQPCDFLMVVGDSAGGNLALMLSSWSKQAPKRPNCVLGVCPSLDKTFKSKWLNANAKTDLILKSGLSLITKLPTTLRLWLVLISIRANPSDPLVSPVFGDLTDLPPTLIHASSTEMLLGDSIRYVNRAREQGSKVTFQVWEEQIHDWHFFNMGHGSADVAWNEVAKFVSEVQSSS